MCLYVALLCGANCFVSRRQAACVADLVQVLPILLLQRMVWCATHTLWTGLQQGPVVGQQQAQLPAMQ